MHYLHITACQLIENDDDHDSGTESDDEGADAEELEKYMDDSLHCDVSSSAPSDRASSTLDTATDTTTEGGGASTRCPSDSALPSDSDQASILDQANHSSEEELEVINQANHQSHHHHQLQLLQQLHHRCPEKRKWSQANNHHHSSGATTRAVACSCSSACSSDDEVRDLMCASAPVEFRASPPANVPKPSRSLSPPPKLFHQCEALPPHELCCSSSSSSSSTAAASSPRKRHRKYMLTAAASTNTSTSTSTTTSSSTEAVVSHRPSLDFEKMQQKQKQLREGKN